MATTLKTFIVDAAEGATESSTGYSSFATFIGEDKSTSGTNQTEVFGVPLRGDRVLLICTKTVAD